MRTCKKCGVELTPANARTKKSGYLECYCFECEKEYQRQYRLTHKEQLKIYWQNPDRFKQKDARREWHNFKSYMRHNPFYFINIFGREYNENNVLKEYKRLDKFMKERGI